MVERVSVVGESGGMLMMMMMMMGIVNWCETGVLLMQLEKHKSGVRLVFGC